MIPGVSYLVFAQSAERAVPVSRLGVQARAHFGGALTEHAPSNESDGVLLMYSSHGRRADFVVTVRPVSEDDIAAAREAERQSARGVGLADLAARCNVAWIVEPRAEVEDWIVLEFCALLASVALGPVLTVDPPALLGVRSARELANAARGAAALTR